MPRSVSNDVSSPRSASSSSSSNYETPMHDGEDRVALAFEKHISDLNQQCHGHEVSRLVFHSVENSPRFMPLKPRVEDFNRDGSRLNRESEQLERRVLMYMLERGFKDGKLESFGDEKEIEDYGFSNSQEKKMEQNFLDLMLEIGGNEDEAGDLGIGIEETKKGEEDEVLKELGTDFAEQQVNLREFVSVKEELAEMFEKMGKVVEEIGCSNGDVGNEIQIVNDLGIGMEETKNCEEGDGVFEGLGTDLDQQQVNLREFVSVKEELVEMFEKMGKVVEEIGCSDGDVGNEIKEVKDVGIGVEDTKRGEGNGVFKELGTDFAQQQLNLRELVSVKEELQEMFGKMGKVVEETGCSDGGNEIKEVKDLGIRMEETKKCEEDKVFKELGTDHAQKRVNLRELVSVKEELQEMFEKMGKVVEETECSDGDAENEIKEVNVSDDGREEEGERKKKEEEEGIGETEARELCKEIEVLEVMLERGSSGLLDLKMMMEELEALRGADKMDEMEVRMGKLESGLWELQGAIVELKDKKSKELMGWVTKEEEKELASEGPEEVNVVNKLNWGSIMSSVGAVAIAAAALVVFFMGRPREKAAKQRRNKQ